jgi:hypothetical protein
MQRYKSAYVRPFSMHWADENKAQEIQFTCRVHGAVFSHYRNNALSRVAWFRWKRGCPKLECRFGNKWISRRELKWPTLSAWLTWCWCGTRYLHHSRVLSAANIPVDSINPPWCLLEVIALLGGGWLTSNTQNFSRYQSLSMLLISTFWNSDQPEAARSCVHDLLSRQNILSST